MPEEVVVIAPMFIMLVCAAAAAVVFAVLRGRRRGADYHRPRRGIPTMPAAAPPWVRAAPPLAVAVERVPCRWRLSRGGHRSGGGSMRRIVWSAVVMLLVLVPVMKWLSVRSRPEPATATVVFTNPTDVSWAYAKPVPPVPPVPPVAPVPPVPPVPPVAPVPPVVQVQEVRSNRQKGNWMKPAKPEPAPAKPPWSATIESAPLPPTEAMEDALDTLRGTLTQDLSLSHPPTREWVNDGRYVHKSVTEERVSPRTKDAIGVPDAVKVRLDVELTPDGWRELGRVERGDRASSRLETAARGLGLLTVLLGAVAGYVRLDEWTKGYYSGRLFLAAAALVTMLGAVIVAAP